ncbi:MKRN2 opposite strand protein-like [Pomacea canaliculata]|uniref:MKRN2 opposite strand protein-like n=1 Tax=Pomacea canaliculata TaxID=400727 RepID=UPI000D73ADED|nr:MKRN2 opposite strand protein-like [Pomacea canaliculata]XP_025082691.1 MKRN2 opposite strand protein-like [Pomacea canaliculata]XP_025082692.1 MKRN2 opposite strand protein-like [Pomacea canaliculata]
MSWPQLKCCQHCDRNTNIVCLVVPVCCPICQQNTAATQMRVPPYLLPAPFISSTDAPCSLVLKQTVGDFIKDYSSAVNLHIGVTDTRGVCYNFDEDGLHMGETWQQCISIPLLSMPAVSGHISSSDWDDRLHIFASPLQWHRQRYHDADCNCFDFVLQFLRFLQCHRFQNIDGTDVLSDKKVFCDIFLTQQTAKAAQYISAYRRILQEGFVLVPAGNI